MAKSSVRFISNVVDKIEGRGEDGPPVVDSGYIENSYMAILGVFDGLGGAGASTYDNESVQRTGAYLAARAASHAASRLFNEAVCTSCQHLLDAEGFESAISSNIQVLLQGPVPVSARLSGTLVKRFPTTVSIALLNILPDSRVRGLAVWAGDSRVYVLHPDHGLSQITADDLASPFDPMDSLRNDPPLSNLMHADGGKLNSVAFETCGSCMIVSATDGCYGYLPTPMHFEGVLLETLMASSTETEWRDNITNRLTAIAGDDVSFACAIIERNSFMAFRNAFIERAAHLNKMTSTLDEAHESAAKAEQASRDASARAEAAKQEYWQKYKTGYLRFMEGQPTAPGMAEMAGAERDH